MTSSRRVRGYGRASLLGYGYPAIGERTWGLGLVAGGGLQWRQAVADVTYRFGQFTSSTVAPGGPGGPTAAPLTKAFSQHELYVAAGGSAAAAGLTGHYAMLHETSGTLGTGHVLGAAARFSPLGNITAEASVSLYDDVDVLRTSAAWQIPLGRGWWLRPGGAVQVVGKTVLGAGYLDVGYGDNRGEIWLGGKGGSEYRPAYLASSTAYNLFETIPWGAHLGGSIHLKPRVSLTGTFEVYGATASDLSDAGTGVDHVGLTGSLGATFSF